ncbi:MAG: molybdopterin-dependent oxidoreductase [Deltaproteobacteria bacterium]|nr:molybdopterin-dependent oxidoreductase [Deltaproteobacteria bacterium]
MTDTSTRIKKTICDGCMSQCGALVHVHNGRAVKIEGDPDHPASRGFMCPKGLSFLQTVYHPDRVIYPMKRAGERGENRWRRISWDQALHEVAEKVLKVRAEYGPESILYSFGTYPAKNGIPGFVGLLGALDSPGTFVPNCHYCYTPHIIGNTLTAGTVYDCEFGCPNFMDSKLVILWGWNPPHSFPIYARQIMAARRQGTKLLVINPRFTELASKADLWLQPRPATDAALALSMIHVILEEGLYDKEFVEKWCLGLAELSQRAAEYPPEKAAEITWVPAEKIIEAARLYAAVRPSHLHTHNGTTYASNVLQTSRAIAILPALTGNIDVPGGNVFSAWNYPPVLTYMKMRKMLRPSAASEDKQLGVEEFPLLAGSKSLRGYSHPPKVFQTMLTGKPYPIKAFFASTNSIVSFENSRGVEQALRQLDLLVSLDFFITPTAELADYLLPSATWLEREDVVDAFGYYGYVCARPKTIEPVGECRDDDQIAFDLLQKMNFKYPIPGVSSNRDLLNFQLKDTGIDFDEFCRRGILYGAITSKKYETTLLRTDGRTGFNTPSGKVEFYSQQLKEMGQDPLPLHNESCESPVSTPDLYRDYPLILIGGSRHIASCNSAGHNIPWLRELLPYPCIEIHPDTAKGLGIAEGDWVWIETPRGKGRVKQKARITLGIGPLVVHAQCLWWYPEEKDREKRWYEPNINSIMSWDPPYDPVCGSTLLKGGLCKVYKAEE